MSNRETAVGRYAASPGTRLRAGWWFGTERFNEFFRATIEQAEFA